MRFTPWTRFCRQLFAHSPMLLCRALAQLFPTRVRLQPPADAATAARHAEQLQRDAANSTTEHNYRTLAELAAARKCV